MKKFLLLPISMAVLAACSSNNPAPVENAGELAPSVMQPVNGAGSMAWEPQVIQQNMPDSMSMPQVTMPTYQPEKIQQNAQQVVSAAKKQVSQNFEIPRDPKTNAPIYSKIDKGFYKGNTYKVRKGDTMFLIAYISGMDVKELAALNNMSEPYSLSVGQTLKIANNMPDNNIASTMPTQPMSQQPVVTQNPVNETWNTNKPTVEPVKTVVTPTPPMPTVNKTNPVVPASNIAWIWPTNGKVIQGFSSSDGGNKGIDISGSRGQAVNAAAAGRVVYAGDALRGYGNLIIIKHNDNYLSAYAHNESILVKDQQEVKAGQQIAKMGSSGTNGVKLHFEIRYKGQSVDPMGYLPKR
ncbi:peptidase M23B [Canicola haemoglobinophilus]|uniref:Peptidase M23B n=1 Tax=Canicola haemoglobinophilus TaxID=733 RepID=A0AB38H847_9PAST|nr:murein hydrolase activator NlpD [Canicola haemoglobinophilus]STO55409.1 peptidase M23B [Canicola haemoglobinophilus]STO67737.1 peptidase M23B [Canicola haemoglobinophilus]